MPWLNVLSRGQSRLPHDILLHLLLDLLANLCSICLVVFCDCLRVFGSFLNDGYLLLGGSLLALIFSVVLAIFVVSLTLILFNNIKSLLFMPFEGALSHVAEIGAGLGERLPLRAQLLLAHLENSEKNGQILESEGELRR